MTCRLIPGVLGLALQGILFLGVCMVLLVKKQLDEPPRSWATFLADSSKQLIGAGWLHVMNLLCSWALDALDRQGEASEAEGGDACDWYFINIVVDCSLGVILEFLILRGWSFAIERLGSPGCSEALESGQYYEPVGYGQQPCFQRRRYVKQLLLWLLVVAQMKLVLVALFLAMHSRLVRLAHSSLAPIHSEEAKLVAVMVVVPSAMNTLQVWLVDAFIKRGASGPGTGGAAPPLQA
jgi:STIMATE family